MVRIRHFPFLVLLATGCGNPQQGREIRIAEGQEIVLYNDEGDFKTAVELSKIKSDAVHKAERKSWDLLYPGTTIKILESVPGGAKVVVEKGFVPDFERELKTGTLYEKRDESVDGKIGWVLSRDLKK